MRELQGKIARLEEGDLDFTVDIGNLNWTRVSLQRTVE
jgi:hypothetical protein